MRCTQVQFHAVENRLVILQVCRLQFVEALALHRFHHGGGERTRIPRNVGSRLEVRRNRDHEHRLVRAVHRDVPVRDRNRAPVGDYVQAILELDGVHRHVVNERVPATGHAVVAVRSRHRRPEGNLPLLACRQTDDNHMIRIAREIFARVVHATRGIGRLGHSRLEVQFTTVVRGSRMGGSNHEVAHRLETCRAGANHAVAHDGFRRAVVPAEKRVSGIFQVVCRTLLVVIARAARPNRALVEPDDILCDATINDAAHVAVPDGERSRKFRTCIAVVPEGKRIIRSREGENRSAGQCSKHYTKRFHKVPPILT